MLKNFQRKTNVLLQFTVAIENICKLFKSVFIVFYVFYFSFDVDSPCFFTPAIHSRIVQFILDRKRFSQNDNEDFAFGIERLLHDTVYTAAYPLHDVSKDDLLL